MALDRILHGDMPCRSFEEVIADMIEARRTQLVSTWHAGKRRELERQIERLQTLLREERHAR